MVYAWESRLCGLPLTLNSNYSPNQSWITWTPSNEIEENMCTKEFCNYEGTFEVRVKIIIKPVQMLK